MPATYSRCSSMVAEVVQTLGLVMEVDLMVAAMGVAITVLAARDIAVFNRVSNSTFNNLLSLVPSQPMIFSGLLL